MKKIYVFAAALLAGSTAFAQASFSDDFESYNVGDYIGAVSPNWTTWDGITGGTEDTQVENAMNNTPAGANSVHYVSTAAAGGPQDCVLPFGGSYNTGMFTYSMDMYVTSGKGAYYNFQGDVALGTTFAFECYMIQTGTYIIQNTSGQFLTGTYTPGQWNTLRWDINLNTNTWNYYINNVLQGSFHNSIDKVAAIDIYAYNGANGGNNQADYYVDNVSYNYTPYTLPTLNAGLTSIGVINPATRTPVAVTGLVGQTRPIAVTVRNLGTSTLNSFSLSYTYNSITYNMNVSAAAIASLAEKTYTFPNPATFVSGNLPMYAVVSNPNAGADMDNADDTTWTNANITTVPAPGKVVVGEEATGTWCPWCVRGAVYMDYMSSNFDGYWAGIAVHNADPMTVTSYDASMGSHVSGYPSALVDRQAAIDPSAIEPQFLSRIVIAPKATVLNGAVWNTAHDSLFVSVTYTFNSSITGTNYKAECVLTEDSCTGSGSTWSQNNAYAGGGNGPMGGFEALSSPVPYSTIHYDHVARAIAPDWNGQTGFPAAITNGYVQTFNFAFACPSTWNENRMHIVGMLINGSNLVDNAGYTTVAQAIGNGYVTGMFGGNAQAIGDQPEDMNIYPNPSNHEVSMAMVNLSKPENVSMTVTDMTGKVIASRDYGMLEGGNNLPINTTDFASGIYLVTITTGSYVSTQKLVVE